MTPYSESERELFRQIILDHYKNPRNKGLSDDPAYQTIHLKNPSCGDDLTVQIRIEGDRILDIRHLGSGCAICCSSASVMSELLRCRTLDEAKACIKAFKLMVSAEPFDENCLEEAVAFEGVAELPPRIKCATLAWLACEEAIEQRQDSSSGSAGEADSAKA